MVVEYIPLSEVKCITASLDNEDLPYNIIICKGEDNSWKTVGMIIFASDGIHGKFEQI